jgi:hypothetical protein
MHEFASDTKPLTRGFPLAHSDSMSDKEIERLIRELRRTPGWRVERGRKHYKAFAPDGKTIVVIPGTPSSSRSIKKVLSQLRRAGFRTREDAE